MAQEMNEALCPSCYHWTYQPCYVAGVFEMNAHCDLWIRAFLKAKDCRDYVYEPGSDPEWRANAT